ncbi:MAG: hypothetical protein NTX05_00700 [Fusobacteria bacterium]|nr:hypothetical protein [Fusobacteriota bacterium]
MLKLDFDTDHIGGSNNSESEIGSLLNEVADLGINIFDTARGYNLSEEI